MSTGQWALGLIVILAAASAGVWVAWRVGYTDGYHAGRDHERGRQAERRIRAARRQDAAVRAAGAPPWHVTVTPRHAAGIPRQRPSGTGSALLRGTGELRAATDRFIGQMQASEESYRRSLTAGAP